jgi:hypothetical protein
MVYLYHYYEPDSNTELTRMQQRAKAYQIVGDEMYKTSVIVLVLLKHRFHVPTCRVNV